jgi:hypothetical protein
MNDRSKDKRWVNGSSIERGFLLFDELPECLFGKGLGRYSLDLRQPSREGRKRRTSILVSSWGISALLLADAGAVLVPVFLGESAISPATTRAKVLLTCEELRSDCP